MLGHSSFLRVKEVAPLSQWKGECTRFLKALKTAAAATVEVADSAWRLQVSELLDHGLRRVSQASSIGELHAGLAATLGELCFLQLGSVPERTAVSRTIPINATYWHLGSFRSVQYVQTAEQQARASQTRVQSKAQAK